MQTFYASAARRLLHAHQNLLSRFRKQPGAQKQRLPIRAPRQALSTSTIQDCSPHCSPEPEQLPQDSSMLVNQPAPGGTYDQQWQDHWKAGVEPGKLWDAGKVSPCLAKLLDSRQLQVAGKRVLVPGCGRGYDVFAFALAGAAPAVGLDLCDKAIAAAAAEREAELSAQPAAATRAELVAGNFFSYVHHSGAPYDLGYDYTFLCALHPDMRKDWAEGWARALAPGGELVTLIFPVGPGHIGNPPWQVTPELYQQLLLPAGFEQVLLEPIPAELSHKGRGGREWLGRWRKVGSSGSGSCSIAVNGDANSDSTSTTVSRM